MSAWRVLMVCLGVGLPTFGCANLPVAPPADTVQSRAGSAQFGGTQFDGVYQGAIQITSAAQGIPRDWCQPVGDRMILRVTNDSISYTLIYSRAVFYVVPNMNPDGSARGNHRTNALEIDLNRAWTNTTRDKSPEVWLVRERMLQTHIDFLLDLHGDEDRPFVWPVHTPGIPSLSERQVRLRKAFDAALVRATPDYSPDEPKNRAEPAPGTDPLAMAISWAAEKFGCLALIIEFPFLDNIYASNERHGWSPPRSRQLRRRLPKCAARGGGGFAKLTTLSPAVTMWLLCQPLAAGSPGFGRGCWRRGVARDLLHTQIESGECWSNPSCASSMWYKQPKAGLTPRQRIAR